MEKERKMQTQQSNCSKGGWGGGGDTGQWRFTVAMDNGVSRWQGWTMTRKQGGKGNQDNTTRQEEGGREHNARRLGNG
jgi:hypothetical protein